MKQLRIIVVLIVMILIVIFSVQNAELVALRFMGFAGEISKTILMLVCFTAGSIVTIIALLPRVFKKRKPKTPTPSPAPSTDPEESAS